MGKGENASYQHFLLFPECFQRLSILGLIKVRILFHPFPKQQILDCSKLKQFPDDNFRFDETGGNFSKRVENTVGK